MQQHDQFQELLDTLVRRSGIGQEVLGEVLARTSLHAPAETSRVQIAAGNPTARRPVDQRVIAQGTVSKAVKALMDEGLLEDGEKFLRSKEGRTVSPVRLGSRYAMAGVKVVQEKEQPRHLTTVLFGLDTTRVLGRRDDPAEGWDQVAKLVHQHVSDLLSSCARERARQDLPPLNIFGVGVEVGAPVSDGEIMPLSHDVDRRPVPLAEMLHCRFEADPHFGQPVPVIVENDVNALAVLAIHQIHYTDPDLVVIGAFEEGVGGGLVMDGRLRRGGNGRAMEIGHLAVGFPPGLDREPESPAAAPAGKRGETLTGFRARCTCGQLGHVDTLAPPRRIEEEFGGGSLDQIAEIDSLAPEFERARDVFMRGGAALGRALAHVSNTVNPSRVIMYLPATLVEPKPDTAAAAYLAAVRAEATSAFAASDEGRYLHIQPFPAKQQGIALLGATAAAVCVLESFIEHALRLDGCSTGLRRTAGSLAAAE
jgi:predicted NBD/HSP70 family sugar kinase